MKVLLVLAGAATVAAFVFTAVVLHAFTEVEDVFISDELAELDDDEIERVLGEWA